MTITVAEQLANAIRRGHASSLDEGLAAPADFVGPEVDLVHEPAQPVDGRKSGPEMAALWRQEASILRSAMPDATLRDVAVSVTGIDEVTYTATMDATMPGGEPLVQDFRVVYTLVDGLIVRACAIYDPAKIAPMSEKSLQDFGLRNVE
jgi:hypothetical protein